MALSVHNNHSKDTLHDTPVEEGALIIKEQRNLEQGDESKILSIAKELFDEVEEMTEDEKERKLQARIERLRGELNQKLGGNWNAIMGKDIMVTVGLAPGCRLFRLKSHQIRLFCFETHTTRIN
jgi:hypothetical protein